MTLAFQLKNKEFQDVLAVSVNGETKELTEECRHIDFEVIDANGADVQVEHIQKGEIKKIKNPIVRGLLVILLSPLILLILTINFLSDNDNGISIHNFFYGENPFVMKKSFKISTLNVEPIMLEFVRPQYDKQKRSFSNPNILIHNAVVIDDTQEISYDRKAVKQDFWIYHYPAYTVLFILIIAINVLMTICLINQFSPFDLAGVVGMSFCCLVTLALLVAFICIFVSTHQLLNQVDRNLSRI